MLSCYFTNGNIFRDWDWNRLLVNLATIAAQWHGLIWEIMCLFQFPLKHFMWKVNFSHSICKITAYLRLPLAITFIGVPGNHDS